MGASSPGLQHLGHRRRARARTAVALCGSGRAAQKKEEAVGFLKIREYRKTIGCGVAPAEAGPEQRSCDGMLMQCLN
jgi:hypothetical protein